MTSLGKREKEEKDNKSEQVLKKIKQTIEGSCYCGSIKYEINAEIPIMSMYCHCVECRKAHGAPLYWVCLIKEEELKILQGTEEIQQYKPCPIWDVDKTFSRSFCKKCGSRIYNEMEVKEERSPTMPIGKYRGIFPGNLNTKIPKTWKPTGHLYVSEAILDLDLLKDDLPRHQKFPWLTEEEKKTE